MRMLRRRGRFFAWAALVLAGASAPARAELAVRRLTDREAIAREKCRVESHPSGDCDSGRIRTLVAVSVSGAEGASIARDADQALRRGYARALSKTDFFHGHFINRGPQATFRGFSEFLANARTRLYHSAEYEQRWGEEADAGIPLARRTPRSFVDLDEDGIVPAIDVVGPGGVSPGYERSGTVYSEEIVRARPGLTTLRYLDWGRNEPLTVDYCVDGSCGSCEVWTMFYVLPDPRGAYRTSSGTSFEVSFHCIDWMPD